MSEWSHKCSGSSGQMLLIPAGELCDRCGMEPPVARRARMINAADLSNALRRAFNLGQTYWQQADSEYTSQHRKADRTRAKFEALVAETVTAAGVETCATCKGLGNGGSWQGGEQDGGQSATWVDHECAACDGSGKANKAALPDQKRQIIGSTPCGVKEGRNGRP